MITESSESSRRWIVYLLIVVFGVVLFMAIDEPADEIIYADDRLGSIEELLPSQGYVRKVVDMGNDWYIVTIDAGEHHIPIITILMVVKYPLPTSNMPPQISIARIN